MTVKLKFRDKIRLSFGVLIVMIVVNALAGALAATAIVNQYGRMRELEQTIRSVDLVRLRASRHVNQRSRESAQAVLQALAVTRQQVEQAYSDLGGADLQGVVQQVDEFARQFQRYEVEADQRDALESRALALGERMVTQLDQAPKLVRDMQDHEVVNGLRGQVEALQWAWQGLGSSLRPAAPGLVRVRQMVLRLAQNDHPDMSRNPEVQRLQFRIARDVRDYLDNFDAYVNYRQRSQETERLLLQISDAVQDNCGLVLTSVEQRIERGVTLAIGLMGALFGLTAVVALLLSRGLARQILRPVQALRAVTQKIAAGDLQARAAVEVDDEIGDLSHSFNHMTQSLIDSRAELLVQHQALDQARALLEQRVHERTAQLAAANTSLQAEVDQRQQAQLALEAVNVQLVASELTVRQVIDTAPIAIFLVDMQGVITQANIGMTEMFGCPMATLVGTEYVALVDPTEVEMRRQKMLALMNSEIAIVDLDRKFCRANGEEFWGHLTGKRFCNAAGVPVGLVGVIADISAVKAYQQQLESMAHFDALTQLPNRLLLADRLQQAMTQSQRRGNTLAVAYLDLDGFKAVNDVYGHDAGDALLVALARRMKESLRDGDTLARIGGDEFVAVLVDLAHSQDCEPLLQRLLQAAAMPVSVDTKDGSRALQVSVSIGVTLFPHDNSDADLLLRHADQAMYTAKQLGKNRFQMFDVAQDVAIKVQQGSLERMRQALEAQEFVLYYQPKVNLSTGLVTGAEALIRWQHPQRGLLAPGAFLPVIEGQAISIDVGEWVITTALAQMQAWRALGLQLPVSVNVGAFQLQQDNFAIRLAELLAPYADLPAGWLQLEVLETSALEDMVKVSAAMKACRGMGVSFALDDFGTGYSSLTYLKRLPAATLKIDQSFVRDMLDDPNDLAIVNGVIGLSGAFGREVIAEGVETAAHGDLLRAIGCELAQGYGIAKPMPADQMPAWVARWQQQPLWTA